MAVVEGVTGAPAKKEQTTLKKESVTPTAARDTPVADGHGAATGGLSPDERDEIRLTQEAQQSLDDPPPTSEQLIERVEGMKDKNGHPLHAPLTDEEKQAIQNLDEDDRHMYDATLDELESLNNGDTNESQYMINVMQHAADISGNDHDQFVHLVGMAFSEGNAGQSGLGIMEGGRGVMGAGQNPAGVVLESMHQTINGQNGGSTVAAGFDPNIVDADPTSTVTHHFGELLQVGHNRGSKLAGSAQDFMDNYATNPGDTRNGYFAAMLGEALRDQRITPQDAVNLTQWAFTNQDTTNKPWDTISPPTQDGVGGLITRPIGSLFSDNQYDITEWVNGYNASHPNANMTVADPYYYVPEEVNVSTAP
ncbi:MAG: hypothetical protein HYU64_00500 [Armatimonadetes bacterium]|nr:hypothetical protein [Armatimonadota bacterium]